MFRVIVALLVVLSVSSSSAAAQEKGLFNFLQQKIQKEIDREQKKFNQKLLRDQYLQNKAACDKGSLSSCDQALAYPEISAEDRQQLANTRAGIVAGQEHSQSNSTPSDKSEPQKSPRSGGRKEV